MVFHCYQAEWWKPFADPMNPMCRGETTCDPLFFAIPSACSWRHHHWHCDTVMISEEVKAWSEIFVKLRLIWAFNFREMSETLRLTIQTSMQPIQLATTAIFSVAACSFGRGGGFTLTMAPGWWCHVPRWVFLWCILGLLWPCTVHPLTNEHQELRTTVLPIDHPIRRVRAC